MNETHGTYSDFRAAVAPALRIVCDRARALIGRHHPEFVEVVWPRLGVASYGVGPRKMSEHYAYIAAQKTHVNLGFYHGAGLVDASALLEGAGKNLRHVKLKSIDDVRNPALQALLLEAIADRKKNARRA